MINYYNHEMTRLDVMGTLRILFQQATPNLLCSLYLKIIFNFNISKIIRSYKKNGNKIIFKGGQNNNQNILPAGDKLILNNTDIHFVFVSQ